MARCTAPVSYGGGEGGRMMLHMAIEDRQGQEC